MRCVAALDVLFRMADNRDHRPGSGACAPSVIVDKRWDAGSEIRLAAGSRSEGGLGGNLNSDIVRGTEGSRNPPIVATCMVLLSLQVHVEGFLELSYQPS